MEVSFIIILGVLLVGVIVLFSVFKLVKKLSEKGVIKNFLLWNLAVILLMCVLSFFQVINYNPVTASLVFSVLGISSIVLCYVSIFLGGFGLEKKQYFAILPSVMPFVRLILSG